MCVLSKREGSARIYVEARNPSETPPYTPWQGGGASAWILPAIVWLLRANTGKTSFGNVFQPVVTDSEKQGKRQKGVIHDNPSPTRTLEHGVAPSHACQARVAPSSTRNSYRLTILVAILTKRLSHRSRFGEISDGKLALL